MTAACLCSKRREEDGGLLDGAVKGGRRKVLGVRSQRREEGAVVKGARRRRREGRRSDVNVKEHDDGDVQDGGVLRVGEGREALVRPCPLDEKGGLWQVGYGITVAASLSTRALREGIYKKEPQSEKWRMVGSGDRMSNERNATTTGKCDRGSIE